MMRMEQERAAEQKELDAAQVWLTRLREEMMRASSPGPTQPAATPVPQHWQKFTNCELESPRWRRREKSSARNVQDPSPSPSPDMPGASEQSVALFQRPTRDRSALRATLIDQGGTLAGSLNRYSPLA